MAYCTTTEINNLMPKYPTGAATTPTTTQAEAIIDQIAAEIDLVLESQGYTVPVTTPTTFVNALKAVNAYGAAALIEAGMFPAVTEKGQSPHWKVLDDKYKEWLTDLKDGRVPSTLSAALIGTDVGGFYTDACEDTDEYPDPVFRKSPDDLEF